MIEAFSLRTAHQFQDAMSSQARLRYRTFVEQRGLQHDSFDGLEFDEFDTPSALYFVWRDDERTVRGVARLLRTTRPYMLQSYWPSLMADGALPVSPGIFEVTRVCVDKTFTPDKRQSIFPELLCGIREFLLSQQADGMIGVTREHLLAHFIRSGIKWLGPAALIEGEMERAFFVPTDAIEPSHHRRKLGIPSRVLVGGDDNREERRVA